MERIFFSIFFSEIESQMQMIVEKAGYCNISLEELIEMLTPVYKGE